MLSRRLLLLSRSCDVITEVLEAPTTAAAPTDNVAARHVVTSPLQNKLLLWLVAALLALVGIFLRVERSATFQTSGPDELFYARFVDLTTAHGLIAYPEIVRTYIDHQKKPESPLVLPPLRITFIGAAHVWRQICGVTSLEATHAIACAASIVALFVAAAFAWRLGGATYGLSVLALMTFAPMEIYSAQRALIDGFFALWALLAIWALWETLQRNANPRWLVLYGFALAAMVGTKENAFFVYVAIAAILATTYVLKFGRATLPVYAVTIAAPALAVLVLLIASGGLTELLDVYRTNVQKSMVSDYALKTGDGPWHRYLIDLALVDPLIILLAVGSLFRLNKVEKPALYLWLFIGATYALMCQVRYGMNLRYASIWDMPLRWLAVWQLLRLTNALPQRFRGLVFSLAITGLCLVEWRQYHVLFVQGGIYDPITPALGHALNILK